MPITTNSLIRRTDYNTIRSIVDNVLGVGSASSGYGQTLISSAKASGEVADQDDWDALRYDIVNTTIHQTGAFFSGTTNTSNSGTTNTLQFLSSTVGFLIVGMAVFGTGAGHPITTIKYITEISTLGSNTIITLSSATESIVPSGTTVNFGPGSVTDFTPTTLIRAAPINQYETLANSTTGTPTRFQVASGQFVTEAATSDSRTWSSSTSPQFWSNEINSIITITFATADQARYFFNSGGEIRIASSRTGGRSDSQNNSWSSILSSAGTQSFGGLVSSTSTASVTRAAQTGFNWYNLTTAWTEYYRYTASSPYASNTYRLEARTNVANNTTGTGNVLDIRVRFVGGYVDLGPGGPPFTNDEIDGTFAITATEKRADGKILPSGNFTIARPTYSISSTLSGT